jgi:hypothetical protein
MSPQEKAKELVNKMEQPMDEVSIFRLAAKKLALIAVDEMIEQQQMQFENMLWSCVKYWKKVKKEIEKL